MVNRSLARRPLDCRTGQGSAGTHSVGDFHQMPRPTRTYWQDRGLGSHRNARSFGGAR